MQISFHPQTHNNWICLSVCLSLLPAIPLDRSCFLPPLFLSISTAVVFELLIGQAIGDFCYDGPGVNAEVLVSLTNMTFFSDITTYYTSCSGTNPFQDSYDSALDAFGSAATVISESSAYLQIDPNYGTNCNANDGGYYSTYEGYTTTLAKDDDGNPLANIFDSIGCSALNPIFAKVLDEALCTSFIDGFYTLFCVHTMVIIFTYIAMFIISFLRWDLQRAEAHNEAAGGKAVDGENVENPVGVVDGADVEEANVEMRESSADDDGQWEAEYDENSGQYYYHNLTTGATTWDKPESLMNEAEKQEAAKVKAAKAKVTTGDA